MGLDGIVSKHRDSVYRAGRSTNWIKVKVKNPASPTIVRAEDGWPVWASLIAFPQDVALDTGRGYQIKPLAACGPARCAWGDPRRAHQGRRRSGRGHLAGVEVEAARAQTKSYSCLGQSKSLPFLPSETL